MKALSRVVIDGTALTSFVSGENNHQTMCNGALRDNATVPRQTDCEDQSFLWTRETYPTARVIGLLL